MGTLFLDFFGTLVDYSPSRVEQGYVRSHELLVDWGAELDYASFLAQWSDVAATLDARSAIDDYEFSMHELTEAFLAEVLPHPAASEQVDALVATYLDEWNAGVHLIDGVPALLAELAGSHCIAVVTNTHHPALVPDHLEAMGLASHIDAVVTSVEVGWRKPHRAIYETALDAMGVVAADVSFVGDTRAPDYDGPRALGMQALLIDPERAQDIPEEHRLGSVLDLPRALRLSG